jgi:hypothetical protein
MTDGMTRLRYTAACVAGLAMLIGAASLRGEPRRAAEPETVMVTLHAKPGAEAAIANILARHWETALRLNLVQDAPHMTVRALEDGDKTYFVEIFTWRDERIPDAAPAEIRALWAEMNRLVEARGGRPGLHFVAVSVVAQ